MAGRFEITKAGDGTFTFEFLLDDTSVGKSPVFEKEDDVIAHIRHLNSEEELIKSKRIRERYVEANGNATKACIDFIKERVSK